MSDPKILFQNNDIEIIENEGKTIIKENNPYIFIVPYIIDEIGNPESIGLMSNNIICVKNIKDDIDILGSAKNGLMEKTGYNVNDTEKWDFLGNINSSPLLKTGNPAFCVNVTNINNDSIEKSNFSMVPINDALNTDNSLIHCLFLKIFQNKLI